MNFPGTALLCTIAAFSVACSTVGDTKVNAPLPPAFNPPQASPDFSLSQTPSAIRKRILASACASESSDLARLGVEAGMTTQPVSSDELYLETGGTPEGAEWFLVRSRNYPEKTYCGLAMSSDGQTTNVSVANVSSRNMHLVKAAIESGDFLCKCKSLSGVP